MKRALLAIAFFFSFAALRCEVVSVNQFGGLNSDDSPLTLQNQTPDSENVVTDEGPGIKGRNGFIAFSTEVASAMWEFPVSNGTRYLITANRTAGTLKATTGDGVFSILLSTIPTDRNVVATPLGDKFFFSDTANGLKYWNTTSVTPVAGGFTFDKLVTFKGRLVGAGVAANPRLLYFSKYLDGTNFTLATNPSDDDPSQITVSGALDENITALYSSFQDKLIWFKAHSFGGIFGSRRSNFTQRTFSDAIGTGTPDSIRDCAGFLRWLGPDRKIWEFDGSTFYKITEDIDVIMATVAQGDSNSRSNTQTSQADFDAGSQNPLTFADTSLIPGSLSLRTTDFFDTTQANFQTGTCAPATGCNTIISSGSLSALLSTQTYTTQADWAALTYDNDLFVDTETSVGNLQTVFPETCDVLRDGTFGTKAVWTSTSTSNALSAGVLSGVCTYANVTAQRIFVQQVKQVRIPSTGTTFYFQITNFNTAAGGVNTFFALSTGAIVNATSFNAGAVGSTAQAYFYCHFLSTSGISEINKLAYKNAGASTRTQIFTSPSDSMESGWGNYKGVLPSTVTFFLGPTTYGIYMNGVLLSSGTHTWAQVTRPLYVTFQEDASASNAAIQFDNYTVSPQTFTFTTGVIDTAIAKPIWGNLVSTQTGTGGISYTSNASADGVTFDGVVAAATGSLITSNQKRYLQLTGTFNYTASTQNLPGTVQALSDLVGVAYTTITYTSRAFDTGFNQPIFGNVTITSVSVNGGGTTSFYTQTSADGSSWDTRVAISTGAQPGSTRRRYIRYVVSSTPTASAGYERLDDFDLPMKATGTWTSQALNIGSAISAWGPFTVSFSTGYGSLTFQMSTSATSGNFNTWNTLTNGQTPTFSVAAFAEFRVLYVVDAATQTPRVDDLTIAWSEGSTIRTASAFFNQRYWLATAISTSTNNKILVYDKKKQWQRYSGMSADAITLYNSKLYFCNSGGIYQGENGFSDNGSAIASYYRTPTYAPNKLDLYSNFDYLYLTTDNSDATMTTTFQVNGINTDYSLASVQMNGTTGIQNFKLPFPVSEVQTGKDISFKWSVSGTSFWRITNANLYHQPLQLPE